MILVRRIVDSWRLTVDTKALGFGDCELRIGELADFTEYNYHI